MQTMTTLKNVELKGSSTVVTFPGDKVAGTTDVELGGKLVAMFERDPEHCLVRVELEERGGKLWITDVEYVEAPEELGGPAEQGADTATESAAAPAVDSPEKGSAPDLRADLPTPMTTLDDLLLLADRVEKIEQFLATKGYEA
jgi:hypothetical protein